MPANRFGICARDSSRIALQSFVRPEFLQTNRPGGDVQPFGRLKPSSVAKLPSFGKMETESQQISQQPENSGRWEFGVSVDPSVLVGVAQLVERWIVAPVAVGSIPIAHPATVLSRHLPF